MELLSRECATGWCPVIINLFSEVGTTGVKALRIEVGSIGRKHTGIVRKMRIVGWVG
jgi:hypothetical protein